MLPPLDGSRPVKSAATDCSVYDDAERASLQTSASAASRSSAGVVGAG